MRATLLVATVALAAVLALFALVQRTYVDCSTFDVECSGRNER